MKLTFLIASALLIVFISQHSTNGLPINDVTTVLSCLEGFELVEGQCQPIAFTTLNSETESTPSRLQDITLPNIVLTKNDEKLNEVGGCPKGQVHGKHGLCKDIVSEDQLTTTEPKQFDKTPAEHETEPLAHTDKPEEHGNELFDHTSEPMQHDNEPLDHTTEPKKLDEEPLAHTDKPEEHDNEPLDHTTEPMQHDNEPKKHDEEPLAHTDKPEEHDNEPLDHTSEPVQHDNEPLNHTTEPKGLDEEPLEHTDKPEEHDNEPLDHTSEPVEHEKKPTHRTGESEEQDNEPLDHTSQSVKHKNKSLNRTDKSEEHENESSDHAGEKTNETDLPKGCPPGTKADEQGSCVDEADRSSTTVAYDLKNLLRKDGKCPLGMELYGKKCVYIKSKEPLEEKPMDDESDNLEGKKIDKNYDQGKLVALLPDNVCPEDTEYYSNGLCRLRVGSSTPSILLPKVEKCLPGEILIDRKCTKKETEVELPMKSTTEFSKTDKIDYETEPVDANEDEPTERKHKTSASKSKFDKP
ncbi:hypothetical protein I4U23_030535 [Adineta vaga]|nr:hypothetical protein I4U23_030535 [Adineta vaga]